MSDEVGNYFFIFSLFPKKFNPRIIGKTIIPHIRFICKCGKLINSKGLDSLEIVEDASNLSLLDARHIINLQFIGQLYDLHK